MKIFLGTDHAGFALKEKVKEWLMGWGFDAEDLGAFLFQESDDYPDFTVPVAKVVSEDPTNCRGIILGGSGQGEAIAANRFPGVRAAVYYGPAFAKASTGKGSLDIVRLSREHNDANILSIGARFVSDQEAKDAIKLWLETPFSGEGRHIRRIKKLN